MRIIQAKSIGPQGGEKAGGGGGEGGRRCRCADNRFGHLVASVLLEIEGSTCDLRSSPVTRSLPRGSVLLPTDVAKPAVVLSQTTMGVSVPAAGAVFLRELAVVSIGNALVYCRTDRSAVLFVQKCAPPHQCSPHDTPLRSIGPTPLYCRAYIALPSAVLHSTVFSTTLSSGTRVATGVPGAIFQQ